MGCGASQEQPPKQQDEQREKSAPPAPAPAPAAAAAPAPEENNEKREKAESNEAGNVEAAPAKEGGSLKATPRKANAEKRPEYAKASKSHAKEKSGSERSNEWERIKALLPSDRSEDSVAKRKQLFDEWDNNGNGKLSLAEIDAACRERLNLDKFTNNLQPILIRAYDAALTINNKEDDDGLIEFSQFRVLLEYIAVFFEFMITFDALDTSDDRRVSEEEFVKNVDKLRDAGVPVEDPKRVFAQIDTNDGGVVLFEEFCDFATTMKLKHRAQ